jgi:hypothetical protein
MAYIKSNNIQVFPAAFRAPQYEEAKRTTEENLVKFNRISSTNLNLNQVFLDPDTPNTTAENTYVIFNIHGYWFRCLRGEIPEGNNLKAYIKLISDSTNDIGFKLATTNENGSTLDSLNGADYYFEGLEFTTGDIPQDSISGNITTKHFGLQIRDSSGALKYQKLKLTADEIRNGDESTKSISEEFNVENLTAETATISEINATNSIEASTINADIVNVENLTAETATISEINATNSIEASTINADQINIDKITKKTAGSNIIIDKILKTPAPDNKTITINGDINVGSGGITSGAGAVSFGSGAVSFGDNSVSILGTVNIPVNSNLEISDSNAVTINGDVTIGSGGITSGAGAVTFGGGGFETGNHKIEFNTTSASTLTLPSTGKLATIAGQEELTNKVINGIKIENVNNGFKLSVNEDGSASTLAVQDSAKVLIKSSLDVGGTNTGKVNIRSAGPSQTTIIGPNNATINLPRNNPETSQKIWSQHYSEGAGEIINNWISISNGDIHDSIVKTDNNASIAAKINGVEISNTFTTNTYINPKLEVSDCKVGFRNNGSYFNLNIEDVDFTSNLYLPHDEAITLVPGEYKEAALLGKTETIEATSTDDDAPTAKAVYNFVTRDKVLWDKSITLTGTNDFSTNDVSIDSKYDKIVIEWEVSYDAGGQTNKKLCTSDIRLFNDNTTTQVETQFIGYSAAGNYLKSASFTYKGLFDDALGTRVAKLRITDPRIHSFGSTGTTSDAPGPGIGQISITRIIGIKYHTA